MIRIECLIGTRDGLLHLEAYEIDCINYDDKEIIKLCGILCHSRPWVAYDCVNGRKIASHPKFGFHHNVYIEVGFLKATKDLTGDAVKTLVLLSIKNGILKMNLGDKPIKSYNVYLAESFIPNLTSLYNPIIHKIRLFNPFNEYQLFENAKSGHVFEPISDIIKISGLTDLELEKLSKEMSLNLRIEYMIAIRAYFENCGREPAAIELYSIAQTWCEHCKHIIFSSELDDVKDGIYSTYIKGSTEKILKSKKDFCLSVFSDNAGAISFDENWMIAAKVETHNSPSAIEPFGGAITGILGVNRDIIGFGMGAKTIANEYVFCLADPEKDHGLFRKKGQPALSHRDLMNGIIEGLGSGGNCAGIPTMQGLLHFDNRYSVTPLVYVGSIGIIPRCINQKSSINKSPEENDLIVIIGGRTGRDGIHGATASSSSITHETPGSIVQLGDPFIQKKLSDALIYEIRDLGLYNAITDNGAGGLSSSIGEMGRNGFSVDLDKVSLKYQDMHPWEIWISESQERMTLSVPEKNINLFSSILERHEVQYCIIGNFNSSGRGVVKFRGEKIMDICMDFLHDGYPKIPLKSSPILSTDEKVSLKNNFATLEDSINELLSNKNFLSREFIVKQYDHEVQGTSCVKPLQGPGKVLGDGVVLKPVFDSNRGVVLSQGLSILSDSDDPYLKAGVAIDSAIRKAIAIGANPSKIALLDNFCWSSSREPERLWQLKLTAKACHDYSIGFDTPFISGKDSMFNDFYGFNSFGKAVKSSAPPTLLISAIGIIDDIFESSTIDAKFPNDLLCYIWHSEENTSSDIDFSIVNKFYAEFRNFSHLFSSSLSIGCGGIPFAIMRKCLSGRLGVDIFEESNWLRNINYTNGFLISISPKNYDILSSSLHNFVMKKIGVIKEQQIISTPCSEVTIKYINDKYSAFSG